MKKNIKGIEQEARREAREHSHGVAWLYKWKSGKVFYRFGPMDPESIDAPDATFIKIVATK